MNDTKTYVVRKEPCPECRKRGYDRTGDNLAIYNDDSEYCFRCGYYKHGSFVGKIRSKLEYKPTKIELDIIMPEDVVRCTHGPGYMWLKKYDISDLEIIKHRILWSESKQFLIFPVFDNGTLIGWQARNFNPEKRYKYLTKGNIKDYLHIIPSTDKTNTLVLVEDLVSAIKVARVVPAMPIFGSIINPLLWTRLTRFKDNVYIWLDPDKREDAIKFAQQGKLFNINTHVVITDKDPKDYDVTSIREFIRH